MFNVIFLVVHLSRGDAPPRVLRKSLKTGGRPEISVYRLSSVVGWKSQMLEFIGRRPPNVKNCKINPFSRCKQRLFGGKCVYRSNPNQVGAATPTATPIGAHRPLNKFSLHISNAFRACDVSPRFLEAPRLNSPLHATLQCSATIRTEGSCHNVSGS